MPILCNNLNTRKHGENLFCSRKSWHQTINREKDITVSHDIQSKNIIPYSQCHYRHTYEHGSKKTMFLLTMLI